MGSLRLTLCAGAVVTAALTSVSVPIPASALAMDTDVSVTPSNATPGSDIQVRARGCTTGTSGTAAASRAFVADALLAGRTGELVGETRIRSTLTPGTYAVKVTCGGLGDKAEKADEADETTGTLTVVEKPDAASAHQSPTAPVSAGGGGTTRLSAAQERAEGPGTPHTVIGLVLAGAAAVAVALRSVRRGRGR
ncbi:hypothetical protein ACFYO0_05260 [Streptomyces sp. NPDC006365]|uniref:hypothetical protein n=1 Tax=Streptomyces sp. NPDC006365 TaxID=3364744 RepID=UPI0036C85E21